MAITTCKWKMDTEQKFLDTQTTPVSIDANLKYSLMSKAEQDLGALPTGTSIAFFMGADGVTYASVSKPEQNEVVYYLECGETKIPWLGIGIIGGAILLTAFLMRGSKKSVTW